MPSDVAGRVMRVIAETQHIPLETITIDRTFQELGIDSLDGINILFALENEFNTNIPDDSAKQIVTVRDAVEGIEKLCRPGESS